VERFSYQHVSADAVVPGDDAPGEDASVGVDTVLDAEPSDIPVDSPAPVDTPVPPEDTPQDTPTDTPEDTPTDTPQDTVDDEICEPGCDGKECGDDGCGGDCGPCGDGFICNTGSCVADCVSLCGGQECGVAGPDDLCNCGGCDDEDPCTDDECVGDTCATTPNSGATCDDGNPCTGDDVCTDGACAGDFLPLEQLFGLECTCDVDADCLPLDDGNVCNGTLYCTVDPGEDYLICMVEPGSVLECEDGVACTADSCVAETGCLYEAQDGACDDGNPCTVDSCDLDQGCLNESLTLDAFLCDDGDVCTEETVCQAGVCGGGVQTDCDDGNPCTEDLCEDPGGCLYLAQAGDCDDGDPCTVGDSCAQGACVDGPDALDCDDDNVCTDDVCISMVGCEHSPIQDEIPCGEDLHCISGECVPTCIPDCVDKDCGEDGCGGICGYCPIGEGCVAGSCDPLADEDLDHDGVCPLEDCAVQATDLCPTVWNPDNEPTLCQGLYAPYPVSRSVILGQVAPGGGSNWRRTHEPVEIPLHSGYLDATVIAYHPLDGSGADDSDLNNGMLFAPEAAFGVGPFGEADGALSLDGQSCGAIPEIPEHAMSAGTLMLWFKLENPHGPGAPVQILADKQGAEGAYALTLLLDASGSITFGVYPSMGIQSVTTAWNTGWHHVAATWGPEGDALIVDGVQEAATTWPSAALSVTGDDFTIGCSDFAAPTHGFTGELAEVVLLSRPATLGEVTSYVAAGARWGTSLLPGTQADWDDLRVTEVSDLGDGEHHVPFELLGPRPHSDTACPAMYGATPSADIPEIWHREDLCGVLGYWRLDGDGFTAPPNPALIASPQGSFTAVRGRFGDLPGAVAVGAAADGLSTSGGTSPLDVGTEDLTVEAWLRVPGPADGVVPLLQKKHTDSPVKGFAVVYSHVNGQVSCEFFSSGTQVVSSVVAVDDGAWHHLACVLERDAGPSGVLRIHVDGMETNRTQLDAGFGSMDNLEPLEFFSAAPGAATFDMELDEVLIHDAAKSKEYLRRRATPAVPTVRFLASTEAALSSAYSWYEYTLHRAGASAALLPPLIKAKDGATCWGLLSPCLGYRGWWRFDEGGGVVAFDASTHSNHGAVVDGVWGPGRAGSALLFNGTSTHVQIPHHPSLTIEDFVMETSIVFDASTDDQFTGVILKGWNKDPDSNQDVTNYMLQKRGGNEKIRSFYEHANGNEDYKDSTMAVTFGIWQRWVGQWRFGKHEVFLEDESAGYIVSGSPPGTNQRDLWFGVNNDQCGQPGPTAACLTEHLHGAIDSIRLMSRTLTPDEFLHYPTAWGLGALED
jgi:hypothetical protein